ncbi:von willebrand factor type A domain-containing protein [Ditylenchus destructor]|nr:von willebrand factor type A domain-containing protein [Ditylenchus destructor]
MIFKRNYRTLLWTITSLVAFLSLSRAVPIDNGLVDSELVKECLSNNTVDLVLILDGSGSIGDDTFQLQLNFAGHLAQRLNVSTSNSHMAIVQFAETPQLEISLNQYTNPNQLENAIRRIKYLGGATNTGQALRFALENGFQGSRGGSVPKVVVAVTDGQSQDDVSEPSHRLRDAQILVYAIGVTNLVNVQQLHQMTGNALRVFTVETFDQLDRSLADSLTWDMCKTEFRPGTPDIICAPDKIGVRASTKKPFDGYVFVADHFHQDECRAGPEHFPDSKSIGITVPFTNCNVHRYRSLNPRGIFVEMTVVFMFHTVFMTKVDQMVKIQCFYMEAEKPVTVPLEVSMITTQFRQKVYQMPRCEYTLRKDNPNGPVVQYATLGQSVYHRWECIEEENKDTFGMLVHSCYVDNGFGDRVDILDENGCGLDAVLLSTPDYDSSLRLATKAYHVFKYADRPVLQFQCQVTLCLKLDGGCSGITPPKCPETKPLHLNLQNAKRSRRLRKSRSHFNRGVKSGKYEPSDTLDVFTKPVMIVDDQFAELTDCSVFPKMDITIPVIIAIIKDELMYLLFFRELEMSNVVNQFGLDH